MAFAGVLPWFSGIMPSPASVDTMSRPNPDIAFATLDATIQGRIGLSLLGGMLKFDIGALRSTSTKTCHSNGLPS